MALNAIAARRIYVIAVEISVHRAKVTSAAMASTEDLIREHKRLCQESAQFRADAIRTRIQAVHAFCSIAECKLRWASPSDAEGLLATIRKRFEEVDSHLRDPRHILPKSAHELRKMLANLEARIERIEGSIRAQA
jgi:hypothetical protein